MNEKKAKQLRYALKHMDRDTQTIAWEQWLPMFDEPSVRRAMQEIGEPTTGANVLNSVTYAANVTVKVKGVAKQRSNKDGTRTKRENVAYSIALSQLRGRARLPRSLWRQDAMGNWIKGRALLREIVKEAINGGEDNI